MSVVRSHVSGVKCPFPVGREQFEKVTIWHLAYQIVQGTSLRWLNGFKEVFIAFKLVIFNSNTHTLPLGHLKVTMFVKNICILKACVKEGIRGGLRGP